MNPITRRVVIDDVSAVHEARRAAAQLAADLGFCEVRREQVAIAASELASNAHKHTRGGDVYLQPAPHLPGPVLEMIAADHGPGVAAFEQCLVDGYSTTGTLGAGLGAVQRLASSCAAYSCPERGTVVLARFTAQLDPPMWTPPVRQLDVGALALPAPGETISGDAYTIAEDPDGVTVVVADGLGHGPDAAEAARTVIDSLSELTGLTPAEQLRELHARLRSTRGAAAAIARIDRVSRTVRIAAVGNVTCAVWEPDQGLTRLAGRPGTLGIRLSKLSEQVVPLTPNTRLVLHSDGLHNRWDLTAYPGLFTGHPAALTAATLFRDCERGRDDATVVVLGALDAPLHGDFG
ncbi:hypothetical protein C3Y87_03325 [Carbonactinospora thermoautotrophica]|uniref:SpoIIE family protein phosphatase n=1 Tax=Carbonactinospora thermoautotrophica TaxID=1469144 RepID=UPI00226F6C95|nr:SpoIIE family protein phosphatase [Carbonactinospora thermoautotrophica]MCX9190463.1 hypothetical protein [Carbonactinospora thermoautotrophica]